jgi:hypothetical protein
MNCKPGDLAMVVRSVSGHGCVSKVIGSPVQLARLDSVDLFGFGPSWRHSSQLRCPGCHRRIAILLDADLQPLRPPPQTTETPTEIIAELTA